jgi:hypothetical protein
VRPKMGIRRSYGGPLRIKDRTRSFTHGPLTIVACAAVGVVVVLILRDDASLERTPAIVDDSSKREQGRGAASPDKGGLFPCRARGV